MEPASGMVVGRGGCVRPLLLMMTSTALGREHLPRERRVDVPRGAATGSKGLV